MPQSLEEILGDREREGHLTERQLGQGSGAAGRKDTSWLPARCLPRCPGPRMVAVWPAGALAASRVLEMTISLLIHLFIHL